MRQILIWSVEKLSFVSATLFAVIYAQFMSMPASYSFATMTLGALLDLYFLSHKKWVQENSDKIVLDYSRKTRPKEIFRQEIRVFYFLIIALGAFAISTRFLIPKFDPEITALFGDVTVFKKFALGILALSASGLVFRYQPELVQELPSIGNRLYLDYRDKLRSRWKNDTRFSILSIVGTLGIVCLFLALLRKDLRSTGNIPPELIPIVSSTMIALVFGNFACVLRGFAKTQSSS